MKIRNKKLLTKSIAMAIFMSSTLYTMPITHAAFNNNTVPSNGTVVAGAIEGSNNNIISDPTNITQTTQNAVIKWDDFSVGANATVNFSKTDGGSFNTLNYVNSGNLSQIYGTINATNGNIYIVNPAGVQIGNSAQINVGSLYVSNKSMSDDQLKAFQSGAKVDTPYTIKGNRSNAELMSLGNINAANKVTFDGNRIVLDVDRVKNGQTLLGADNITIKTTEADLKNKNVVLGYTAYDDSVDDNSKKIGYEYTTDKNNSSTQLAKLILDDNSTEYITKKDGFMWVKDGEQLQAMNTNLGGNYAFRNSIDLNATADNNVTFYSVGNSSNPFTGNLDGLGNEVYGLHIKEDDANTGLFGVVKGSTDKQVIIRNFNLISGSITNESKNAGTIVSNTGAVVGNATNAVIENVKNTINVTGENNVGGIIGTGSNVTLNGVVNAGAIKGNSNVGGLAGSLVGDNGKQSFLTGESYNLGDIKGLDTTGTYSHNIGGLVGSATNSTIGNKTGFQMYNHLDVTGGYNVGGIVGNLENGSTVQNVYNDGNILATGYTEGTYKYHTDNSKELTDNSKELTDKSGKNGVAKKSVNIANVGGIVGSSNSSEINNVLNSGDISSNKQIDKDYYDAGNVGGIVGNAVDTNITDATNKESNIRGAHNVGGIAGYFGNSDDVTDANKYTIENAVNNGGDILATGARINNDFVTELIRSDGDSEVFHIGNMGGIAGYMYGDNVYINKSANRGTVHSLEITGNIVNDPSKAANAGGIVGKIDRTNTSKDNKTFAVNNSYNTGNIQGYTGIGGIAGMMYNGEIGNSYNLGNIQTTRISSINQSSIEPINMGGIVGDTTEASTARAYLYNVYNKGQIGDETYTYYGRHVGGVAGRLSGDIEKAYNNGAIYNGYSTVGGIVGWWFTGNIKNVFNTGNITVLNKNQGDNNDNKMGSEVGGIAGATNLGTARDDANKKYNLCINLENAYNLGTIRSFWTEKTLFSENVVGGIIGSINAYQYGDQTDGIVNIKNVYTLGNIWVGNADNNTNTTGEAKNVGSIYGRNRNSKNIEIKISGSNYIKPKDTTQFTVLEDNKNNANNTIEYENRLNANNYKFDGASWAIIGSKVVREDGDWRIYNGKTTPILNIFLPETNGKFNDKNVVTNDIDKITNVQYGTAYDPLLTIIKTTDDITMDWENLGIYGDAGLAVYGGGLTLDNFKNSDKGVGLFGGIIYSDGVLNINSARDNIGLGNINSAGDNIGLGNFSKIYGSSININAGTGTVDAYGSIISTGNTTEKNSGDITIKGGNVNTYGEIKTAVAGETTTIDGIQDTFGTDAYNDAIKNVNDETAKLPDVAEGYAHTTNNASSNGNIYIFATDGDVNIYYGNMENGIIDTQGNVNLEGKNIYVDSDMVIDGNLNATADNTGEIVVDISNIGKVSLKQYTNNLYEGLIQAGITESNINNTENDVIKDVIGKLEINLKEEQLDKFITYLKNYDSTTTKLTFEEYISDAIIKGRMHNFLHSFYKETGHAFNFKGTDNAKITVDLWNGSAFDLGKYDIGGHTLSTELSSLNITKTINNNTTKLSGRDVTYIWVADGEQLKGVQDVVKAHSDYNFALKNDINATDVSGYQAIGSGDTAFTGKFDGRGNRIIGLNVDNTNSSTSHTSTDNVGVFGTIGEKGIVKNLKVYSSTFKGYDNVGAIAGTNNGTIDNVTTLGNTVEAVGSNYSNDKLDTSKVGAAGGVVGTNNGTVNNATSRDSVIAGNLSKDTLTTAGGVAGINIGLVSNSQSHSAVIASGSKANTYSLGGIVGVNTASDKDQDGNIIKGLDNVNAYGVTGSSILVDNTGGIAGINKGTLHDAYNESIVKGYDNVGGIAGTNSGEISLIVNGASVTAKGDYYAGGLVGKTTGSISNGRNNGVITGVNYVGGLVGSNGNGVTLEDLTNDSSAEIIGKEYVGGIAGTNSGSISTTDTNLINRGSITGNKYIGGIAGENKGTIANVNNDIVLNVTGTGAEYFGGVTGINTEQGTIKNATNRGNINASGATYVGGIAGENNGKLENFNGNYGNVKGKDQVGGVVGQNDTAIKNVNAYNEGSVTATDGGAGGIFATYNGNIVNSTLTNKGNVKGTNTGGTGGIATVNSGNISNSTLINEGNVTNENSDYVGGIFGRKTGTNTTITGSTLSNKGEVKGKDYVGGIFGSNESTISKSTMTNEVGGNVTGKNYVGGLIGVNSGTITGGRDENSHYYKYQIYNNGTIKATGNGSNIGGLIGYNKKDITTGKTGSLTAGYNTGNIVASGSTNVGGIVGTNEGTVDQVFNTIMTVTGENTINGKDNVGAIIGNNIGTGKLTNAYSTNGGISNLIGLDNSISRNYKIDNEDYWKTYVKDGQAYKVLKVFLTSVKYDSNKKPNIVYNGQNQYLNVNVNVNVSETDSVLNSVFEDLSGKQFLAQENTGNKLIGSNGHKNAGTYTDWLYSGQIASSGAGDTFNPNNLGYDIDLATGIKKAQIDITLNDIERIYGSLDIINNGGYGFTYNNDNLTPAMIKELKSLGFSVDSDSALVGDKTKDVGSYTWTGIVTLGSLSSNYELKNDNDGDGSITSTAISKVTPKTLTLKDLLATIVYGNQDNKGLILQKPNNNTDILNGIVYGDDVNINLGNITLDYKNDSAYDQNRDNRVTADVGIYGNSLVVGNISLTNNEKGNYKLDTTTTGGSIQVTPATLTVGLNNVSHKYGAPNLNDYGIDKDKVAGLTNGDEESKDKLTVTMTKDDALKDNNTHTNDVGNYTWTGSVSGIEGLGNNYIIKVNEGQSVVNKAKLDIIIDNTTIEKGEHPNYNGQFGNDSGTNNFTNGDTPDTVFGSNWDWGITNPSLENETGTHGDAITIIINGNQYITSKEDIDKILPNYDVNISFGDLTVKDNGSSVPITPIEPIKPVVPGIWSHIHQDKWDRNRNFKERKAEFNFVDGAIPLDEAVEEV